MYCSCVGRFQETKNPGQSKAPLTRIHEMNDIICFINLLSIVLDIVENYSFAGLPMVASIPPST